MCLLERRSATRLHAIKRWPRAETGLGTHQSVQKKEPVKGKVNTGARLLLTCAKALHSYRSATKGSTRAARRAGNQQARNPVIRSRTGTQINVHGSYADTPHSCVARIRPNAR